MPKRLGDISAAVFFGPRRTGGDCALRQRHIGRGGQATSRLGAPTGRAARVTAAGATLLFLAGFYLTLPGGESPAEAAPQAAQGAAPAEAVAGRGTPNVEDVVAANAQVRGWVDAMFAPPPDDPASAAPIDGASACCVIVRRGGRVIGLGTDLGSPNAARGGPASPLMVRRAAGRAISDALGDSGVRSMPLEFRDELGPTLCLELEIAGRMAPLPGRSLRDFAQQLEPGLDGIALRRGESWAVRFPAHLRASNLAGAPDRALPAMAQEVGLDAKAAMGDLLAAGVSAYRFRALHLVQTSSGAAPFTTVRGEIIVSPDEVTRASLARLAHALAARLVDSRWSGDQQLRGLRGTYQPLGDRYDPPVAPAAEQALGAMALARYARSSAADPPAAAAATDVAMELLSHLAAANERDSDPRGDLAACAAVIYALAELPSASGNPALRSLAVDCGKPILEVFASDRAHRATPGAIVEDKQNVPVANEESMLLDASPHVRAMLAGAMARLLRHAPALAALGLTIPEPAAVRDALDRVWAAVPEIEQVSLLPWIGWAELDYADAAGKKRDDPAARGEIAHAEALERLRASLRGSQIGSPNPDAGHHALTSNPELIGAFVLRSPEQAGWSASSAATAQSMRPAAWLAVALRDPRLTPPEQRLAELAAQLRAMRFALQLSVRPEASWWVRNPKRAMGGVREALWDNRQSVPAQALALIAAVETLLALEALAAQNPPKLTEKGEAR